MYKRQLLLENLGLMVLDFDGLNGTAPHALITVFTVGRFEF